jgi:hypothetical protein
MSGRHGRSNAGDQDQEQAATEAEAAATATVIAGLRWRLRCQETLEHPKVLSELHKLEDQVAEQLGYIDRNPGRHRSSLGNAINDQASDAPGVDFKPDPLAACTPEEFVEALWQYKAWSGDPSWRRMASRAGQAVVHSTMYAAMNGDTLPKLDVVKAIIIGCGGGDDDVKLFASAWRRLTVGRARGVAASTSLPSHDSLAESRLRAQLNALDEFERA